MKKIIRTTSQWVLIGLLSTSPILPGISTVVEASADQNITAQDNSFSQQKSSSMGFDYDETTGTLSISSGVLDNPIPLSENGGLAAVAPSKDIKKIIFTSKVTAIGNLSKFFANLPALTSIEGLDNLDTSQVTDMSFMFFKSSSLEHLDVSTFNTSNVVKMAGMFSYLYRLPELDVSNFVTTNVTEMNSMFAYLESLSSLDVSNFDTTNVTNMNYMFYYSGISSLDLSSFDTSKSSGAYGSMLIGTSNLKQLTLGPLIDTVSFKKSALPSHQSSEQYTDKWQNVGNGTVDSPKGENIWTSDEFMTEFSPDRDADTYVWQPQPKVAADVTVKYENSDGEEIHDSKTLGGNVGDSYDATTEEYKLKIDGYNLDESNLPSNATGTFTDQAQTVTYVYSKDTPILDDLAHITVHDSNLKVGDKWSPENNFDEATDFEGNIENFSDIIVDGTVDTTKPGTYEVTYRIPEEHLVKSNLVEGHHSATAKIVVANKDTEAGGSGSESNNSGNNTESSDKENSVINNLAVNNDSANKSNNILPQTGEHSSTLVIITGISLLILGSFLAVFRFKKINN